ncbi:unnamed protein product, partial [Phaeothamnion confervicola]
EGSKNGEFKNYDREGHLLLEGNFMNGRLHGDNTGYYADGTVKHRFNYEEGNKIGTALTYHTNGKLKLKEQPSLTGQDWVVEEYTDADKLISVKRFKNKHPNGQWEFYYPDGKTERIKENYENGKLSGIRHEYFEDGKLAKEEMYKFNLLTGPYKTYYKTGGVEAEGELR